MKWKFFGVFLLGASLGIAGTLIFNIQNSNFNEDRKTGEAFEAKELPLLKYTIENLGERAYGGGSIILDEAVATTSAYTASNFHCESDGKRVYGRMHLPQGDGPFPVIVQVRGFQDRATYTTGDGTKRSAAEYAKAGFISLAADYLGYGGSASPSADVFEARFETYTTTLNLLAAVKTLPEADASRIGMWGHSNGGQIVLTVLEASGRPIPATLWAPVTARFPFSILVYTDDYEGDGGKALRKDLARFETEYDTDKYAFTQYLERISGPLQIHQGTTDSWVPVTWSREVSRRLKVLDKNVTYLEYPGDDHNLLPDWNTVVARDIEFFKKYLDLE